MPLRLQMLHKPPVIFTQYAPSWVITPTELAMSRRLSSSRNEAISWLWVGYGRSILAEVDPCMEANEGAAATIALTTRYKSLSRMEVTRTHRDSYELKLGDACLYLTENEAGDVFLYFFSPDKYYYRREECRLRCSGHTSVWWITTNYVPPQSRCRIPGLTFLQYKVPEKPELLIERGKDCHFISNQNLSFITPPFFRIFVHR